jgi:hypothetical protein
LNLFFILAPPKGGFEKVATHGHIPYIHRIITAWQPLFCFITSCWSF